MSWQSGDLTHIWIIAHRKHGAVPLRRRASNSEGVRRKDYTLGFSGCGPRTRAANPLPVIPATTECSGSLEDEGTHNLGTIKLGKLGRVVECQGVYFGFRGYRYTSGSATVCVWDASCHVPPHASTSRSGRGQKDSVGPGSCRWKCQSFPPAASLLHSIGLHVVVRHCGVWRLNLRSV